MRQGQSNFLFSGVQPDAEVQRWARVADAGEAWRRAAPAYDGMVRSAHELDRIALRRREAGLPMNSPDLVLLRRGYRPAFQWSRVTGMVEKANETEAAPQTEGRPVPDGVIAPEKPSPPRLRAWLVPWGLPVLLLAPSVYWVVRDRSVWSWDPAFYAMDTVDLWLRLVHDPANWLQRMTTVFVAKAPGIAWLGQFFVPLGRWLGSVELGLLVSVLVAQLGTLALIYSIGRSMAPRSGVPAVLGVLFMAASPLFVSMSHHYLTEALQGFSITYVYWVALRSPGQSPPRTIAHLVLAVTLGTVTKVATPAFVVFPACLATAYAVRGALRHTVKLAFGAREAVLGLAAVAIAGMGFAWYRVNWRPTLAYAKLSASSDLALEYGRRDTVWNKLLFWLGALRKDFLTWPAAWVLLVAGLVVAFPLIRAARGREGVQRAPGSTALLAAAGMEFVLVFAVLSTTVNEDTRYLMALGPALVVVLVWAASATLGSRAWPALILVLAGQWAMVHARQVGVTTAGEDQTYWNRPPGPSTPRTRDLSRLVDSTCRRETANQHMMIGVNLDWLNVYTLSFFSAKAELERGFRCAYVPVGTDPVAAWERLARGDIPFFVSVEESSSVPEYQKSAWTVLRRVERGPEFVRVRFDSESDLVLFGRAVEGVSHLEGRP